MNNNQTIALTLNAYKFLLAFIILALLLIMPNISFASYPQPKGGPSRQIIINKLIFNPGNNQFVDNLSVDQHTFLPGQEVTFRLQITNTSSEDLNNVIIKDKLPNLVDFVNGPGTLDKGTNTLNFTIEKLKMGETKTFDIKAKIKTTEQIPANITCVSNMAEAKVDELMDQDSASFCLNKQILGVTKQLPVTGPDTFTVTILLSILALGTSTYLFKKTQV